MPSLSFIDDLDVTIHDEKYSRNKGTAQTLLWHYIDLTRAEPDYLSSHANFSALTSFIDYKLPTSVVN